MLLVATPEKLSVSQAVAEQLQYTFSAENPDRWWFITWALAPIILLLLSASCFVGAQRKLGASWLMLAIGATVTLASSYLWPSVFLPAAVGVYCAFRSRSDA